MVTSDPYSACAGGFDMGFDGPEQFTLAKGFGQVLIGADNAPLALSNKPSLLDSIMTGVDLNSLLF